MARMVWGQIPDRMFEIGVDRGVLAIFEERLVPWTGLVSITESSENSDLIPIYQNGHRVYNYSLVKDFMANVEAFTYPDELELSIDENIRRPFNLSYRTDVAEVGYKLHLVYNCVIQPSSVGNKTLAGAPEPQLFNWSIFTKPRLANDGLPPAAHFIIDSTMVRPEDFSQIEDILYGTETTDPRFPTPFEIRYLLGGFAPLEIIPAPTTGLADIVTEGRADLAGNIGIGLYQRPPGSRLNDRVLGPGLNRLE